jgi:hypothetical protein
VDFLPYEGAPSKGGHELKRLTLTIAIAVVMLGGAWGLAASAPVPGKSVLSEARMTAPATPAVDNIAASDTDVGPGDAESELAFHPIAAR